MSDPSTKAERQIPVLPPNQPRDPAQIGQILRACGLPHESLALSSDGASCCVSLEDGSPWTYDELALVADKLGTTDLRMEWERGEFRGSEHTPGDTDSVTLTIRWPAPARDAAR